MTKAVQTEAKDVSDKLSVFYEGKPVWLQRRDSLELRYKLVYQDTGRTVGGWEHASIRKLEDENLVTREEFEAVVAEKERRITFVSDLLGIPADHLMEDVYIIPSD